MQWLNNKINRCRSIERCWSSIDKIVIGDDDDESKVPIEVLLDLIKDNSSIMKLNMISELE